MCHYLDPSRELDGWSGEYKDFKTSGWESNALYWWIYPAGKSFCQNDKNGKWSRATYSLIKINHDPGPRYIYKTHVNL